MSSNVIEDADFLDSVEEAVIFDVNDEVEEEDERESSSSSTGHRVISSYNR
jgi:hypothetical protein